MTRRNVETYANDQQVLCRENDFIPDSLFKEYGVNRGLRDVNGVGVLTGLTNISKIVAFQNVDGQRVPCEGQLFYYYKRLGIDPDYVYDANFVFPLPDSESAI